MIREVTEEKKVVKYVILDYSEINKMLDRGWELYGSPMFESPSEYGEKKFYQAMIKYEECNNG